MKKYILLLWALLSLSVQAISQTTPPPIISLGGFYYDHTIHDSQGRYKLPFLFPDLVAAELLQEYQCFLVDRNRNMDTATEADIRAMTTVQDLHIPYENYATADYSIKVAFSARPNNNGIRGHVYVNELLSGTIAEVPFTTPSLPDLPKTIATLLADTLQLKPKPCTATTPAPSNQNYAVIAPRFFDTPITTTQAVSTIETILLSGSYPMLERAQFQSILDEQVLKLLKNANPSPFQVMNLLDADRIIALSAVRRYDTMYMTMSLIDTHTAIILDAISSECSVEDILNTLRKMAPQLRYDAPSMIGPVPSTSSRLHEAQFLLSKEQDPHRIYFDRREFAARWVNSINASETAAMLCHQDEPFLHTVATNLARQMGFMLAGCRLDDGPFDNIVPQLNRACILICTLLQSNPSPQDELICAEVSAYAGNTEQAKDFLKRSLQQSDLLDPKRLLRTKAWIAFLEEDYLSAQQLLHRYRETYNKKGTANMLFGRTALLLSQQAEGKERLDQLTQLLFFSRTFANEEILNEFLILYRQHYGPKATLAMITEKENVFRVGGNAQMIFLLNRARCHLAMGNYRLASKLSLDLFDSASKYKRTYHGGDEANDYLEQCSEVRRQIPHEYAYPERNWKRAAEVRPLPSDEYIYLIPLGDEQAGILPKAAGQVGRFWGHQVKIAPSLELPESLFDSEEEGRKSYRINPLRLMHYLSTHATIPDDALYVAFVTREPLGSPTAKHMSCNTLTPANLDNNAIGNPAVVSYNNWGGGGHDITKHLSAHYVAAHINTCLRSTYLKETPTNGRRHPPSCTNFPCSFSAACTIALPTMCEECQKDYLHANFERIKGALKTNLDPNLYTEDR